MINFGLPILGRYVIMRTFCILLLLCASVSAGDFPSTAQTNGFRASLYLTDSRVFETRTNGFGLPAFTRISKVKREAWFCPAIVFSGPGLRSDGTADIVYGLVVRKPDGSVLQELDGLVVTRARFRVSDEDLHLARDTQGIRIKPDNPAGTYNIVVTLEDRVKHLRVSLEKQFTIEK